MRPANGLACGVVQDLHAASRGYRQGLAAELRGPAGEIPKGFDGTFDLHQAREVGGLAVVQALEHREIVGIALDEVGESQ